MNKQIKQDIIKSFDECKYTTDVDILEKKYIDFIMASSRDKKHLIKRNNTKFIQDLISEKILDHFSFQEFSFKEAIDYAKFVFGNGQSINFYKTYVFCAAYKAYLKQINK